jgi:hypothetical protein
MTTAGAGAWQFLQDRWAEADARVRSLLLWGAWSDGVHQRCECCGTRIVVLESTRRPDDLTDTWKRWVEVVSGDVEGGVCNIVVRVHDQARCQELRTRTEGRE